VENEAQANGRIWFVLEGVAPQFIMDDKKVPSADRMMDALGESNREAHPLTVRIYLDSGQFQEGTGRPTFTVGSVTLDGKTVAGEAKAPPLPQKPGPQDRAALDLVKAVAFMEVDDAADARAALDRAIAPKALAPFQQSTALGMRGEMIQRDAFTKPAGDERDKLLIAALQDFEAWKALSPDSGNAAAAIASTRALLGDYDEAVAEYRAMLGKYPRNRLQTYLEIARIHRMAGEYDKSLAALDELVKTVGPQNGMAYHYHRAWTLNAMGRYGEAAAEITAGLKDQQDYPWAYMQRACAYGQSGKLEEAIADQEQVVKLLKAAGGSDMKADESRAEAALAELRAAHAKTAAACTGYAMDQDAKRTRSALLPAAAKP
jgi:tetratricopeptide (TPR) repeat protein